MSEVTLGVDPGDRWIGFAILSGSGEILAAGSLPPEGAAAALLGLARRWGVALVGVERAGHLHASGSKVSLGSRGGALARANWIGGEIAGTFQASGFAVLTCSASTWRAWLCGSASADGPSILQRLRSLVPWVDPPLPEGATKTDKDHPRDACGLALWSLAQRAAREVSPIQGAA